MDEIEYIEKISLRDYTAKQTSESTYETVLNDRDVHETYFIGTLSQSEQKPVLETESEDSNKILTLEELLYPNITEENIAPAKQASHQPTTSTNTLEPITYPKPNSILDEISDDDNSLSTFLENLLYQKLINNPTNDLDKINDNSSTTKEIPTKNFQTFVSNLITDPKIAPLPRRKLLNVHIVHQSPNDINGKFPNDISKDKTNIPKMKTEALSLDNTNQQNTQNKRRPPKLIPDAIISPPKRIKSNPYELSSKFNLNGTELKNSSKLDQLIKGQNNPLQKTIPLEIASKPTNPNKFTNTTSTNHTKFKTTPIHTLANYLLIIFLNIIKYHLKIAKPILEQLALANQISHPPDKIDTRIGNVNTPPTNTNQYKHVPYSRNPVHQEPPKDPDPHIPSRNTYPPPTHSLESKSQNIKVDQPEPQNQGNFPGLAIHQ